MITGTGLSTKLPGQSELGDISSSAAPVSGPLL